MAYNVTGLSLPLPLNSYSEELKSEMARRLNYFVPQGMRWITQPIFGYIFDKKILNLDTEHLKQVGDCSALQSLSCDCCR